MADADGGVGRIVTQKNLLNLVNMAGTQIQAEAGSQSGESVEILPLWHSCSAAGASENDGLHQSGDRELLSESCGSGLVSAEPGNDLHRDLRIGERGDLLMNGAVERSVTVVQANHLTALSVSFDQNWDHFFKGERAGADPLAVFGRQGSNGRADEGISPNKNVRLFEPLRGSQRQ